MLILQYKVSFTYGRLGRCFRFVYIYACCIAVFLCCYHFSVNKDLYKGSFIEMWQVSGGKGVNDRSRRPVLFT